MIQLSNLVLLAALTPNQEKLREQICTIAYSSYFAGCIEQHYSKNLDDRTIQKVIVECKAKGITFTTSLELCKDAKFE